MSPKLLDIAGIAFFGVLIVVGIVASGDTLDWLERYAGELSNVAIFVIALLSVLVRRPFTLQYARETVPRDQWEAPLFLHINYVITWVWVAAFAVMAASGLVADGPLNDPGNVWLGWVIPIGAIVLAVRFTDWYPDVAVARAGVPGDDGQPVREPTVGDLLLPLTGYLVPVGVVALIVNAPWWLGVGLIVAGSLATKALHGAAQEAAA